MLRVSLSRVIAAARAFPGKTAEGSRAISKRFVSDKARDSSNRIRDVLEEAAASRSPEGDMRHAGAGPQEAAGEGGLGAAVGNFLTFGGILGSAYFGYYTYKYPADEMDRRLDEAAAASPNDPFTQAWVQVMGSYMRLRRKVEGWIQEYSDPPTDKLLPDIPPNIIYPRFTVVLDLNDTLVHSDWTRGRGWRTYKRPGLEDFIGRLAPQVELVMFTDQMATYGEPIMDRIDPQRMIRFRLYRDSTQYHKGKHVRDLSKLNRNMNQIIFITSDPDACLFQPDNAVKIQPWKADEGDTVLLDLIPFIELIVKTNVSDVRDVMRSYAGTDVPTTFRKRMEELAEYQKQHQRTGLFGISL